MVICHRIPRKLILLYFKEIEKKEQIRPKDARAPPWNKQGRTVGDWAFEA